MPQSQSIEAIGEQPSSLSQYATREVRTAIRDGLKLGGSLLATWSVALVIRFFLPRHLGPAEFGLYTFADGFAATYFVFLSLGLEMYIQKEIPVRPGHASEFFGGVIVVRAALTVLLIAALELTLSLTHRPPIAQRLVLIFGLAQMFMSMNQGLAALLQARSTVGGLAATNVVGKAIWGLGVGVGMLLHARLEVLAAALLFAEAAKSGALFYLTRRQLALGLAVDLGQAVRVILKSAPLYVNAVAIALCSKLDVTMLSFLTGDNVQVGWYSAAANLATLTMLLSPVVGWVLTPLLSRTAHQSREDFWAIVRRALLAIQTVMIPITLFVILGADIWIRWMFGEAYAPATLSLRALAPTFFFTYVAIFMSLALVILNRAWTLTLISFAGMIVNPVLALIFVPLCGRWLGTGGAGAGSGLAVVGMEVTTSMLMLASVGRNAIDRHSLVSIGKTLSISAVVTALHLLLAQVGGVRLVIDALVYVILAVVTGAFDYKGMLQLVRNRREAAATLPSASPTGSYPTR